MGNPYRSCKLTRVRPCSARFEPEGLVTTVAAVATTLLGSFHAAILFGCSGSTARLWQWLPLSAVLSGGGAALHLTGLVGA